jgi:hypothetical protein
VRQGLIEPHATFDVDKSCAMIDDRPNRNSMSIEEATISTGTTHGVVA